ncbi:Vacuolar protein sorting-associated protein 70 [Coemansia sp. RSA 1821]|nr:hypothetical protein BX667DRAFT_496520 [Coemansia mojavensis]KAJ1750164.1 Vacuolar protein sorting-associated protein 70 [Coemansia sp. RSA 1821]
MFDEEKQTSKGESTSCNKSSQRYRDWRGPGRCGKQRQIVTMLALAALALVLVGPWLLPPLPVQPEDIDLDDFPSSQDSKIDIERLLFSVLSAESLRSSLEYYTSGTHIGGSNQSQATHTLDYFKQQNIDAEIVEYYPWLNRPLKQRVAIVNSTTHEIAFEASLKEDVVPGDPASDSQNDIGSFHGYSANGSVSGRLVYANYGRASDFDALQRANVNVNGSIVIVRYGKVHSGLKVYAAELAGAKGVLIYSDPADDGYTKGKVYPAGPWRPESSIQRDSVLRQNIYPGDPLTPGYPATRDAQPIEPNEASSLSTIPSLPLSYRDALPLLNAMQTHGSLAADIDSNWVGGLTSRGIEYWTGPSEYEVQVENIVEYKTAPIRNVIGRIKGSEDPGQAIVIGNHRDSWSSGAADPSSGAAVLLELARAFGELQRLGWRPRRTIVLASWDAAEYGLVGSTEWVEENVDWLRASVAAYVNVGAAVDGGTFAATASPIFKSLLYAVTKRVLYPHSNDTLYAVWRRQSSAEVAKPKPVIDLFGAGGDSLPFAMHAGISTVSLGFTGSSGTRHSNFDSFKRMITFIDPDMRLHLTAAQVWGLLAIRLADDPVLQLCPRCYAKAIKKYIHLFEQKMQQHSIQASTGNKLHRLRTAQRQLETNAAAVEHDKRHLRSVYGEDCQMTGRRRHATCLALRRSINDRLSNLERHFIDPNGVPGRKWYKHALVGPGKWDWTEADHQPFPALAAALETGNKQQFQQCEKDIANIIHEAAWFLREV